MCNLMVILSEMDWVIWVQILDEAVVFHFVLMPLEKAWFHMFSPKVWENREKLSSLALVKQLV